MSFVADLKIAFRSLTRVKGLALTVIVTLALGIGANAAIGTGKTDRKDFRFTSPHRAEAGARHSRRGALTDEPV